MYNIETLCEKTGMTRRNVHYYVQRGLLPGPEGGGRGAYYTEEHLAALEKIAVWSRQGVPLFQMRAWLSGEEDMPEAGVAYGPASGVEDVKKTSEFSGGIREFYRMELGQGIELQIDRAVYDRGSAELLGKKLSESIRELLS